MTAAIRAGVVFLVAVAVVACIVELPRGIRDFEARASANAALSYSDREIAGGNAVVVDQRAVYEARARIPKADEYHVAVGTGYPGGTELTARYVDSYFRYFLMPRRPAEGAPWIICYGCDLGAYGPGAEVVWQGEEDISIVRVTR